MNIVRASLALAAALVLPSPLLAVQLVPVVTSGLSSPVFVGHAGDRSNRLFIEEQSGIIRVLQPGSSTPTVFLDIHSNVLFSGERGLLGLAFHPQYASNGRFFVYYTRTGDGAIVVAEYAVSAADKNIADPTERVTLTIPHPTNANHNGGMIAFGPDGYLYIGVGDGGSGNDPPNNAQNLNLLLGKILRIDIDPPVQLGVPYVSPPTNPFYGAIPGRDEIFAVGMRNPWRFSFDRATGLQWVGDVGQGAREEVDTPILAGGNFGWRVFEGTACTSIDPSLCDPSLFIFPVLEYSHSGGRCSITGGYVSRAGTALPFGTYVYGDFCTGEIFTWDGATQRLLLDTAFNISSFGEDEQGELYVVNLGGAIYRIAPSGAGPCPYSIDLTAQDFSAGGGTGSFWLNTGKGCSATAISGESWIHVIPGANGFESLTVARYAIVYTVDANPLPSQRSGTITVGTQTFTVRQNGAGSAPTPALPGVQRPAGSAWRRPGVPRAGS